MKPDGTLNQQKWELKIFGSERHDMIGGWRKLHEVVHNLSSSPNCVRTIKWRRMR
jgi:hypothetical protein